MIVTFWMGYLLFKLQPPPSSVICKATGSQPLKACVPTPRTPSSDHSTSCDELPPEYAKRVLDFKEYARKKKKEHEDKMTKEVDMLYERFLNNCHFELNLRHTSSMSICSRRYPEE